MKKLIYIILSLWACIFIIGCKSKIQYTPIERIQKVIIRDTIRDTIVQVKLVPYFTENKTRDNKSFLENKYAFSNAFWDGDLLHHTLGIKDIDIPVRIQYIDRTVIKIDSIPYPVEVPIKGDTIYEMKWHEEIFFYIGLFAVLAGLGYGAFRVIKKKLFG